MPRFDILTIFPEFFGTPAPPASGILGHGILRRALLAGLASVHTHDLRSFTSDRHRTVDDRPFGGGEGMVLKPEPIAEALRSMGVAPRTPGTATILLSAGGRLFTQAMARQLASLDRVVLICGRYEGVDERIAEHLCDEEISVGDYVLSGGELPAALLLDATVRLLPGALGNAASSQFESFGPADASLPLPEEQAPNAPPRATHGTGGLLDYPHYTRPAQWEGHAVPEVLTNGDHDEVRRWRRRRSLEKTLRQRPDLLRAAEAAGMLTEADEAYLDELRRR